MKAAQTVQDSSKEPKDDLVRRLIRRSHLCEALTFVAIVLVSPVSFILGLPLGVAPQNWLKAWTHWTFVLIALAMVVAVLGFEAALAYRLEAERLERTPQK